MRVLLPFFMISFLLVGCNQDSVHPGTAGFVTQFVSDDQLLIGNVIFHITRDTKIRTSNGDKLNKNDLKIGMKVQPFYVGGLSDSFPKKAKASLLRVLEDETSQKESVMMINVIDQLRRNEDEHFIITEVVHKANENKYIMNVMRRSNVDMGFTITVDEESHEIDYMEV